MNDITNARDIRVLIRALLAISMFLLVLFVFAAASEHKLNTNASQIGNISTSIVLIVPSKNSFTTYYSAESGANTIFPMENDSNISSNDIQKVIDDYRLFYRENFRTYYPANEKYHYFFAINNSSCRVELSYYGIIGFLFERSDYSYTSLDYLDKSPYIELPGIRIGSQIHNISNVTVCGDDYYGYITTVNNLNKSNLRTDITYYYIDNFIKYYAANASNELGVKGLLEIDKLQANLTDAIQSGSAIRRAYATESFFNFYRNKGFPDQTIEEMIYDIEYNGLLGNSHAWAIRDRQYQNETKSSQTTESAANKINASWYNPFWHTVVSAIIMVSIGILCVIFSRKMKTYENLGKKAANEYISNSLDVLFSFGGIAYFVTNSPSDLLVLQIGVVIQWLAVAMSWYIGYKITLRYD